MTPDIPFVVIAGPLMHAFPPLFPSEGFNHWPQTKASEISEELPSGLHLLEGVVLVDYIGIYNLKSISSVAIKNHSQVAISRLTKRRLVLCSCSYVLVGETSPNRIPIGPPFQSALFSYKFWVKLASQFSASKIHCEPIERCRSTLFRGFTLLF